MEEERLCFINRVGQEEDDNYKYEFMFSTEIDDVWGDDFDVKPCGMVNHLIPYDKCISSIRTLKTNIDFSLIQESCCFSMQDCFDLCVSVAFAYTDYNKFIVKFDYGETLDEVVRKLQELGLSLEL